MAMNEQSRYDDGGRSARFLNLFKPKKVCPPPVQAKSKIPKIVGGSTIIDSPSPFTPEWFLVPYTYTYTRYTTHKVKRFRSKIQDTSTQESLKHKSIQDYKTLRPKYTRVQKVNRLF
jgi:hypothetical protein